MKKHTSTKWLSTAALGLLVLIPISQALAETKINSLEPITVTANRIELLDTEAPYATEIYSWEEIQKSGATTLYDFLGRNTSMNVMPSYGNPFSQLLDMRGFGIGDGYQNIIVTIDGRRMNNIDMQPQLLSSIPLHNIERIEIIKGSGSVAQGDGATAGTLNIITRKKDGGSFLVSKGSHGHTQGNINLGVVGEKYALSLGAEIYGLDGYRDEDPTGQKDTATANNLQAGLQVFPTDEVELRLGAAHSKLDVAYGQSMSKEQFKDQPKQATVDSSGNYLTFQKYETNTLSVGASVDLTEGLQLVVDYHREEKDSDYISDGYKADYKYNSTDLFLKYKSSDINITFGAQGFDGERDTTAPWGDSLVDKNNLAGFVQGQYKFGSSLFSAGVRHEIVLYEYNPTVGNQLKDYHRLTAWDLGFNQQFTQELSGFINLNQAFQAPDIDRFFDGAGGFNDFVEPAETKTLNVGVNYVQENNKLKVTAFYTKLDNEIYYYGVPWPATSYNTNIDKSYKYGIEIQDQFKLTEQLSGSLNYTWLNAVIDKEDEAAGAYNGKDLPGVSEHNISLSLDYAITDKSTLMLTQVWRSKAYVEGDFNNSLGKAQKAYRSTNLGYNHKLDNLTLFAQVDNIFDQSNGIWIENFITPGEVVVYPVNFTRTWQLGARLDF